jgi:hypothetical protein
MNEIIDWTTEQELLLRNWGIRAKYFVLMHYNSCRYYRYFDNCLGAPSVVIDAIVTSVTFGSLAFTNCETDFIFKVISGNILFISVTFAALHKYFKFSKISSEHNESHYRYSSIIKDIEEELSIDRKNREDPRIFMHRIKENFDNLLHSSPNIPKHIMKKYVEDLEKSERIKLTDKDILIRGKTTRKNSLNDIENQNEQIPNEQIPDETHLNKLSHADLNTESKLPIPENVPMSFTMARESIDSYSSNASCDIKKTKVENYLDIHKDIQHEFENRLNIKKKQKLKDKINLNNFL